jgi:hypothetical protein
LDDLCAVGDFSRVGALRLHQNGQYLGAAQVSKGGTPPFIERERLYAANRALEADQETAQDLAYLQGRGTSLGGMRPKCTVLDEDGFLVIGKFLTQRRRIMCRSMACQSLLFGALTAQLKAKSLVIMQLQGFLTGGADGTRTRDPRRDRPVF